MPQEEKGWLIEQTTAATPLWWDGEHFVKDANKGLRFARQEDAEKFLKKRLHYTVFEDSVYGVFKSVLHESNYKVTEHIWMDAASAPSVEPPAVELPVVAWLSPGGLYAIPEKVLQSNPNLLRYGMWASDKKDALCKISVAQAAIAAKDSK